MSSNNNNNMLLLFSACLLLFLKNVESQNDTNFSINIFTPHSQKLTYQDDAVVLPDEPFVRLTPNKLSAGRVLYNSPVTFWDQGKQLTFETNITLLITPYPGYNAGEGMTFFIVPVNSTFPTTGGLWDNLGIYNAVAPGSPIFAVEIDTFIGHLDPPYKHIGINIDSVRSQNTTGLDDDIIGQPVTLRITYDAPTRKINVVVTYGSTTKAVSSVLNLAAFLPKQVQLGLSASASNTVPSNDVSFDVYGKAASFDVYTWHFNSTLVSDLNSVTTNKINNDDTNIIKQYVV